MSQSNIIRNILLFCQRIYGIKSNFIKLHLTYISCRNPSSMSDGNYLKTPCMSQFGAPVPAKLAFGGYEGDDVTQAEAFVLTIVVRNHANEADNKKAEAWEKVFIDYLHLYSAGQVVNNSNISIAYSSERSIQDELETASKADVWTMLGSYLLMFGYIAVGLGQFRSLRRILVSFL